MQFNSIDTDIRIDWYKYRSNRRQKMKWMLKKLHENKRENKL